MVVDIVDKIAAQGQNIVTQCLQLNLTEWLRSVIGVSTVEVRCSDLIPVVAKVAVAINTNAGGINKSMPVVERSLQVVSGSA